MECFEEKLYGDLLEHPIIAEWGKADRLPPWFKLAILEGGMLFNVFCTPDDIPP